MIEVVAGLMLLGTLLVSILVAHRRHADQIRRAERRIVAAKLADALLTKWSADGNWGAIKKEGRFDDREDFAWRWDIESARGLEQVGAAVGRLEVVDGQGERLAQVEVLTFDTLAR